MHAARLGFQCVELLTTRRLRPPIAGEPADWLRAVRRGDVVFDERWRRCVARDEQLASMATDESIPAEHDRPRIDAWSIATHRHAWGT